MGWSDQIARSRHCAFAGEIVSLPHGLECDETPARQDVARLIGASEQRCRTVRQTWRARYG